MRISLLSMVLMLAPLTACDADKAVVPAPPAGSPDREDPTAGKNPAHPPAEALPTPEGAPDREKDPIGFLQWRIDQMFQLQDVNVDGTLEAHEFQGPMGTEAERRAAFERIDADDDSRLTQEEVMNGMLAENPGLLDPKAKR